MQILFRLPHAGDVQHVATHMRQADVAECAALGCYDTPAILRDGIARSVLCWAVEVDGTTACIVGVTPLTTLLSPVGVPWLLGTDDVYRHRRALIRRVPEYIDRMLGVFPHLLNFVHAENAQAVRFLRGMGFSLDEPEPYGPNRALFHKFEKRA